MMVAEVLIYKNFKEKINIMRQHKDMKFTDLGDGVLLHYEDIGQDEPSASILCRNERRCKIC